MFWGVTLENGKRYTQLVDTGFHVSMAAMEFQSQDPSKKSKPISVMIEHEKSEFLLCTLQSGGQVQQPLDLNFIEGEEVTFFLNGQGTVHLTGYLMDANDINDTLEMEPSDSDDEDEKEINTKVIPGAKRKSPTDFKTMKKPKTEDLKEDEDDDDSEDDSEDEDFEMGDSFAQEDDDTEESSDEEESDDDIFMKKPKVSPKASPQAGKPFTPGAQQKKADVAVSSPSKQQGKSDSVKKGLQDKTPQAHKKQQQQSSAKKTPQQPAVNGDSPAGETPGSKKKRKRKKKLEGEAQTPKSPTTPNAPKGKQSQPSTPKSSSRKIQGGTEVTDLTPGSGPVAKKGRFVQITYVGKLKNNQVFDSSKKDPLRFRLGQGEVIKGMDFGIEGMKVGGKRKIIIPPQQGYGNKGSGPIPPNSTLFFEVELKAVS